MRPERLAAIPVFAGLSPSELEAVSAVAGELAVEEGDAVSTEGDFGHAIYAVESGTAAVVVDGSPIRAVGPGDVVGEVAVLASGRRTASVVATSPMRLISLFKRDVWSLDRQAPDAARRLRHLLDEHTRPAAR